MAVVSNTHLFNVTNALDYYNPMKDIANTQYYMFAAKNLSWPNSVTPNTISTAVTEDQYTIYEEMIFGVIINPSNVLLMVNRYNWVSGTVYSQYDDLDSNLINEPFFVVTSEAGAYNVFKCLNNNNAAPSLYQPLLASTSVTDNYYMTADGYQWKYLYTIDPTTFTNFATATYIPVIPNQYVTQYAANGAIDAIIVTNGGNNYISNLTGKFSAIGSGVSGVTGLTNVYQLPQNAASNTNFYTGSSIYLLSGTGAGQIQTITNYVVNSTATNVIFTTSSFLPQPDSTTVFQIAPAVNINGDGSGAQAYAVVNTATQQLSRVDVINGGAGYTYASINIVGNTGTTSSNSAGARAIISPKGGHGANVYSELFANKVGVSVTFANNMSGGISSNNQYCRIGILKGPLAANVILTMSSTPGYSTGEQVVQIFQNNAASISSSTASVKSYIYNCQNFKQLTVTNSGVFTQGSVITQTTPTSGNGVVTYVTNSTSIIVRQDAGSFSNGGYISSTSNTAANTLISGLANGFTTSLYGLDSNNTNPSYAITNTFDAFINYNRIIPHAILPSNTNTKNYTVNTATATISLYNYSLGGDIVTINVYTPTALLTASNTTFSATGTYVTSGSGNQIELTNVQGQFLPAGVIYGLSSAANATILSQNSGPVNTFNQTLRLSGVYNSGTTSIPFVLNDYVTQPLTGAYGYIQDISANSSQLAANGATFYVTSVKGTFQPGLSVVSNTTNKNFLVQTIQQPDLIKYSGEIIYAENITAIPRSLSQSETVQVVLQFF